MPRVAVRIPQIGEGLQEARLVAVLKQPGERVRRDEPIYQMETDKAVMDVESPYEGTLTAWLAEVDTILPIGAEVAQMEVADSVEEQPVHAAHADSAGPGAQDSAATATAHSSDGARGIPPRTRAYAKEKGVSDDVLASISPAGSKLMPSDIDAYLAGGSKESKGYSEQPVGQKQRLMASRLQRGSQLAVPGTISVPVSWEGIESLRARVKASGSDFQPSAFTMFSFAVAQALKDFPMFRSTLRGEETLRTYDHVHLGIAVALPGDQLVLAVVEEADTLEWRAFAEKMRERIDHARGGNDQAGEAVTISLTNMQAFGLRDAVPVVVPPAVATLYLGGSYNGLDPDASELRMARYANVALTFDHRLLNGVGAAEFLNKVKANVETISSLIVL